MLLMELKYLDWLPRYCKSAMCIYFLTLLHYYIKINRSKLAVINISRLC